MIATLFFEEGPDVTFGIVKDFEEVVSDLSKNFDLIPVLIYFAKSWPDILPFKSINYQAVSPVIKTLFFIRLKHQGIFRPEFDSLLLLVFLARNRLPYFFEVSNESVLLSSDFFGWHTELLVKNTKHVIIVETIVLLKHFDENGLNILLHDCRVETILTPGMSHQ